jgi:hypothetical protein
MELQHTISLHSPGMTKKDKMHLVVVVIPCPDYVRAPSKYKSNQMLHQ